MELTASAETRAQWNALLEDSGDHDDLRRHGNASNGKSSKTGGKRNPAGERTGKTGLSDAAARVREGDLKEYRDTFRCLKEIGLGGFLIRNLEAFHFERDGNGKDIRLDYSVYTYNSRAQAFWQEQGVQRDTVPYELNERESENVTIRTAKWWSTATFR